MLAMTILKITSLSLLLLLSCVSCSGKSGGNMSDTNLIYDPEVPWMM